MFQSKFVPGARRRIRASRPVWIGQIAEVPGEQRGHRKPSEAGEDAADTDPTPLRQAATRSITVEHGKPENDQHEHYGPAQISDDRMIKAREAECGQEQRKYDHQRDGQSDPSDGADGKKRRDHVEPNEAAFLVFIIDELSASKMASAANFPASL